MEHTNSDYFKMGAVVAVGELFDQELLGNKDEVAEDVKCFLESFGISGIQDMRNLGMGDHYLRNFANLYSL